jgi:hypothetical protein
MSPLSPYIFLAIENTHLEYQNVLTCGALCRLRALSSVCLITAFPVFIISK